MTQLFIQDVSRDWSVLPLTEDLYRISLSSSSSSKTGLAKRVARAADSLPVPVVEPTRIENIARRGALLLRRDGSSNTEASAAPAGWAILAGPGTRIRINGIAIAIGITTLRHRDEIGLEGGAPLYFSTERLARVETYAASDSPRCPRCSLSIEPGDLYVCCPGCNVLHHQRTDSQCFTYSPSCSRCNQSSSLEAGFLWSPEGL